jgi:hypothetical protein
MVRAAKLGGDEDDGGDEPHRHRLRDPLLRDDQPVVAGGVAEAVHDPRRGQGMGHSPQADDPGGDVGRYGTHTVMVHCRHPSTQGQKAHRSGRLTRSVGTPVDWLTADESVHGNGERRQ